MTARRGSQRNCIMGPGLRDTGPVMCKKAKIQKQMCRRGKGHKTSSCATVGPGVTAHFCTPKTIGAVVCEIASQALAVTRINGGLCRGGGEGCRNG